MPTIEEPKRGIMSDVTTTEDFKIIRPIVGVMMAVMMWAMFTQLVAAETANLSGSVVDTDGNPVSAALVTLNGATSESSADGVYGFLGVTSGDYSLGVANAEALGYQAKAPISIHLNAGENSQDIILTPQTQKANLSGTVKDSQSNLPIAGIALTLDSRTASTSSSGLYSFIDVNLGTYTLTASKAGYRTKILTITLSSGDNTKDIFITPEVVGANLSGVAREGSDTGPPLAGVAVSVNGNSTTTNSLGEYSFSGLDPGGYTMSASKEGYESSEGSIVLYEGDNTISFYMVPETVDVRDLYGYVTDGSTGDPIPGVLVQSGDKEATSLSDGYYRLYRLPVGAIWVTCSKTGYSTLQRSLTLVAGSGPQRENVVLWPSGVAVRDVDGYVIDDRTGALIANVLVQSGSKVGYTNSSGYYKLDDLTLGTVEVTYSKDGYYTKTESFELVSGSGAQRHDVELTYSVEPQPKFELSDLQISPPEVYVGETVEISVLVTNVGDAAGTRTVTCDITPSTYTPLEVVPVPAVPFEEIMNTAITALIIIMFMGAAIRMVGPK